MAKRPSTPGDLRDAVERTVQATLGSAERQRERTQGALDDLAGTVDQLRRGAEAGIARGRRAIEERLPAKRSGGRRSASGGGAKRTASGGGAKRTASGGTKPSGGRRSS